ncbi:MAG: type II toxin-antitoxin system RelE/ParE family toxin [Planctomycetota bacterium]
MPAKLFIEDLDEPDQRKLDTLFRRMADTGKIFNREQFKQVAGKIYEFKRFQVRVGCFQVGNRWILTHGFIKKGEQWPRSELERAERIMNEQLAREKRGSK